MALKQTAFYYSEISESECSTITTDCVRAPNKIKKKFHGYTTNEYMNAL